MKNVVAIIDGNALHRTQMVLALQGQYSVRWYGDATVARADLPTMEPRLVIVGQTVGSGTGLSAIRELQTERAMAGVPVLFVVDRDDFRLREHLMELGVRSLLTKPYTGEVLMATVRRLINGVVMQSWQELPPLQRRTLEGTLQAFDGIANDLAKGRPPSLAPVTESCSAVVELVARGNPLLVLEKLRRHDNFTYVHSMRFAVFMTVFARAIGLSRELQVQVASGGLLHDIGMTAIPASVLNKPETLDDEDWRMMRSHVQMSQKILQMMGPVTRGVSVIVGQHHERLDGSGYPNALRSGDLSELARMAAIIDIFCALTDRRPYKPHLSASGALAMMAEGMGGQIDLDLLSRFREILLDTVYIGPAAEAV